MPSTVLDIRNIVAKKEKTDNVPARVELTFSQFSDLSSI